MYIIFIWFSIAWWLTIPSYTVYGVGIATTDSYCSEGIVNIEIENGKTTIEANEIVVNRTAPSPNPDTPTTCCDNPIAPHEKAWYTDPTCGSGNTCVYRMRPPAGKTAIATVGCP